MNILDFIILIPAIYFGYRGFSKGLIIELIILLALLVGAYMGLKFSDKTAIWLKESMKFESPYMPLISFVVTFIGVGAAIFFGGKVLEKMIKTIQLGLVNKIAGAGFGLAKGLYIVSLLLVFFDAFSEVNEQVDTTITTEKDTSIFSKSTKEKSILYFSVKNLSLHTIPGMSASQVFIKNAWAKEKKETGLSINQVLKAKHIADSLGIDASDAKKIIEIHEKYATH
jgi:membrane protein required for colicin V production